jgi:hypothetical protein
MLAMLLVVHGVIHLVGWAKAFGVANLPHLIQPISHGMGVMWLAAALLFFAAAVSLLAWPRGWWAIGACAVAVSMIAIASSWGDAKLGMLPNALAFAAALFGFLAQGPLSLRAEYDRDVARGRSQIFAESQITEDELAHLPAAVRRYLCVAGVIGRPRVQNVRVRMHGRIRNGADARWMPITAEQFNFVDPPGRFFYLNASMFRVPVQGYHRFAGASATMRVKVAALFNVVDASGGEMNQAEMVTLFNDMCVFAPATLIDPGIEWETVDAQKVRATFAKNGRTTRAELSFNEAGELTNFRSDDRYQTSPDSAARRVRWSTPLTDYRSFGTVRLASRGEGRWHEDSGEYAYIELTVDEVQYNLGPR